MRSRKPTALISIMTPDFSVDFAKLVERISQTVDADSEQNRDKLQRIIPISAFFGATPNLSRIKLLRSITNKSPRIRFLLPSARARPSPISRDLSGTPFMTSTEALRNTTLPASMIIIGGGYIGCELGHAYGSLRHQDHFFGAFKTFTYPGCGNSCRIPKSFQPLS